MKSIGEECKNNIKIVRATVAPRIGPGSSAQALKSELSLLEVQAY